MSLKKIITQSKNEIKGWQYYNHAVIPTTAPHEEVNARPLDDGTIWKIKGGGTTLLARWTSDFDCKKETEWWYIIKDTPFDISDLKAKRRYEINKGKKNFDVRVINPNDYVNDLYRVTIEAYSQWPKKYRPAVDEKSFKLGVANWNYVVFAGFNLDNNSLSGYALINQHECYAEFNVLRVVPEAERKGLNAAMVAGILEFYSNQLGEGFYINDGSRSIRHETAFQNYLEKYFEFRKAYCKLNIKYKFPVGVAVKVLYPLRNQISKESKVGSLVSAVLQMEEIKRNC